MSEPERIAVITGASSDIGLGLVEAFTRQGCHVFVTGTVPPVGGGFSADRRSAIPSSPTQPPQEIAMPFVSIRITREGNTAEQKAQVIREVTDTLERVLHKAPERTHVVIEEVETDNWGVAGLTATVRRRGGALPGR